LCRTLQPALFFDVGANDGSTSIAVRAALPNCTIHAFEANPQIYTKNRNKLLEQGINFWNLAIGDQIGTTLVYAPLTLSRAYVGGEVVPASIAEDENTGKTSLLLRDEEATYTEFKVQATTLDAFVDAHVPDRRGRVAFLWVDVEGASDRVLLGSRRLLAQTSAIF
jgi:FkbM family methyltransferase